MDAHKIFDTWEESGKALPWAMQLVNYVGYFTSKAQAEAFRDAVISYRKKNGLKPLA